VAVKEPKEDKPAEPKRPDRLTTAQINEAMADTREAADECYGAYGIEGMASFKLVIGASGSLTKAEQAGDFVGTPTGVCLDKAVQKARFPKSKKKGTPITYPIVLR
jgi:hypothetical protein